MPPTGPSARVFGSRETVGGVFGQRSVAGSGGVGSLGSRAGSADVAAAAHFAGERVILRGHRESDVDDRLCHPIDPEEEDGYGSSWRREWDGRRYHTREHLTAGRGPLDPGAYKWAVGHGGRCIGGAGLRVDPDQHCAAYTVGLFVAGLRGRGLGREITRLVLSWAFGVLGAHRIELQVLADNSRAINCYLACGFRQEGIRREAGLYPDGWNDFLLMGLLQSEYLPRAKTARAAGPGDALSAH